jgi:dihydrolipoamide dehydrogenase
MLKNELPTKIGKFPFKANARARCIGSDDGFVKIISHAETDRILGVHIIGAGASEMVAEPVIALSFKASTEDIAMICHGHPTLSESFKEATLNVHDRSIHI